MKSAKPQVNHSQHGESQRAMSPLQSALSSAASPSQAYETYIDNGLICLKHKIRNIEKKKLKLEDYKDRLKNGEQLNPDQLLLDIWIVFIWGHQEYAAIQICMKR